LDINGDAKTVATDNNFWTPVSFPIGVAVNQLGQQCLTPSQLQLENWQVIFHDTVIYNDLLECHIQVCLNPLQFSFGVFVGA
jgi:hypothetical protein